MADNPFDDYLFLQNIKSGRFDIIAVYLMGEFGHCPKLRRGDFELKRKISACMRRLRYIGNKNGIISSSKELEKTEVTDAGNLQ